MEKGIAKFKQIFSNSWKKEPVDINQIGERAHTPLPLLK